MKLQYFSVEKLLWISTFYSALLNFYLAALQLFFQLVLKFELTINRSVK